MLQPLRFVMHAVPRIAERSREIRLDDAMSAYRAQCGASTLIGETHAAIAFVRDQPLLGEATHHPAHRCRRDTEDLRDLIRARTCAGPTGLARRLDLVDDLEVVLDWRSELS